MRSGKPHGPSTRGSRTPTATRGRSRKFGPADSSSGRCKRRQPGCSRLRRGGQPAPGGARRGMRLGHFMTRPPVGRWVYLLRTSASGSWSVDFWSSVRMLRALAPDARNSVHSRSSNPGRRGRRAGQEVGDSGTKIHRARLVLVVALAGLAMASAILTPLQGVDPALGRPLSILLAIVAAVTAALERLSQLPQSTPPSEDEMRRTLNDVGQVWMRELERSLGKLARIELRLAERSGAVDNPLPIQRPVEPDILWPRGTPIITAYRDLGEQLLILGQPGAGKSTLLLQLAQQLLKEADDRAAGLIPLVFRLSSWSVDRRPIAAWLVDELRLRYNITPTLGQALVNSKRIIPLLD